MWRSPSVTYTIDPLFPHVQITTSGSPNTYKDGWCLVWVKNKALAENFRFTQAIVLEEVYRKFLTSLFIRIAEDKKILRNCNQWEESFYE